MNYMQAVEFMALSEKEITARVMYQKRECCFNPPFDRIQIVPFYMIHEAIFQTAGRLVRFLSGNQKGGIVASFRNFAFSRAILPNEMIHIQATCVKCGDDSAFFRIKVSVEQEEIFENGTLILLPTASIISSELNQQMPGENERIIPYLLAGGHHA